MVQVAIRESMDGVVCNAPLSDESNSPVSNVHATFVSNESSASTSNVYDPEKAMLPAS